MVFRLTYNKYEGGCSFGINNFNMINKIIKRGDLKLPSKLFFTKNHKIIYLSPQELGYYINKYFGFSRINNLQGQICLLYNEKSKYNNIIRKVWGKKALYN